MQEGVYGKLISLNLFRISGRPIWSWNNWMLDPNLSGGVMHDLHIHDVDFVNFLLGMPAALHATRRISQPAGSFETIHAIYHYPDGPQVHIHGGWSNAQIPFNAGYEAWFENGFLRLDPSREPALAVYEHLSSVESKPAAYEPGDAYYNEIAYFLDCVENDLPLSECPPASARDSLALLDKETEAIQKGWVVAVIK
jgi:predicted dehydrogenase